VGIHSILEVLFPSLRDPDFNRWEVDGGLVLTSKSWGGRKCSRRRVS
jgi:hypothetical protein